MSAATGLLRLPSKATGWIDDRMNPIVVKELRQAVKSRFVVTVLLLMLALLMVILTAVLFSQDSRAGVDEDAGANLFLVFQSILLATCTLFVPLYVGVRLAAERNGAASDLIYVTTIRPSSIVWGKLLAGTVITALTFSACAPFMVITYLLRGIDLPTILFVMGLDALIVLAATQLAIFVGAMPIGWVVKTLLGLGLIGFSIMTFVGMVVFVEDELLRIGIGSAMDDSDFWVAMSILVGTWLAAGAMVFFLSVAMIAPATANRALWPRVYFTAVWAASFAGLLWLTFYFETLEPILIWLVLMSILLMCAAVISASERQTLGPRLRRSIPRKPLLRPPAFLFYSGAAGGLVWVQALVVLTLVATYFSRSHFLSENGAGVTSWGADYYDPFPEQWLGRYAASAMWMIGYLLLSAVICRRLPKVKNGTMLTGVVGLILIAVACVTPIVIAFGLDPDQWDRDAEFWLMLNPFGPVLSADRDWLGSYGETAFALSIVFYGLMLIVNLPWYWCQVRGFAPPSAKALQTAPSVSPSSEALQPQEAVDG
ncbi:MAG: hypothetical protein AAF288_02435 [Planctomycetota bacterium]